MSCSQCSRDLRLHFHNEDVPQSCSFNAKVKNSPPHPQSGLSAAITQASISSPLIVHLIITPFPIQILLQACGQTLKKEAADRWCSRLTSLRWLPVKYTAHLKSQYWQEIFLLLKRPLSKDTLAGGPAIACTRSSDRTFLSASSFFRAESFVVPRVWNLPQQQVLNCHGLRHGGVENLAQVVEWANLIRGHTVLSFSAEAPSCLQRMRLLTELRALEEQTAPLMVDVLLSECGKICTTI